MRYVIAWPVGMVAGYFVGHWLTGHTFAFSAQPNADLYKLVLLAFVAAGGIASATLVSGRWWRRRKK
jgi:hypothetical protein